MAREMTFLEFFQAHRRGEMIAEADSLLSELLAAIQLTGAAGTLTIKLPFKMNKAGQIECTPQVEAKKPRRALATGIYYATEDNRLTRTDPNQREMFDELEERRARDAD